MNPAARLALVDRAESALSIVAQCGLLRVARSTLYWRPAPVSAEDLALMRRLDEQYLSTPFYGARRMVAVLRRDGWLVNRKRVRRLMRLMGIEAIYQKPNTSRRHPQQHVYPYLLRDLLIVRPNQVWCADITYIPLAKGFVYLVHRFQESDRLWGIPLVTAQDVEDQVVTMAAGDHGSTSALDRRIDGSERFGSAGDVGAVADRTIEPGGTGRGSCWPIAWTRRRRPWASGSG